MRPLTLTALAALFLWSVPITSHLYSCRWSARWSVWTPRSGGIGQDCGRKSRARSLRRSQSPFVKPAISAGALLILISSLAHFGVPSILGFSKNIYTLPTMIYALIYKSSGSFEGIRQGAALFHPSGGGGVSGPGNPEAGVKFRKLRYHQG